jgi:hypothetical protein
MSSAFNVRPSILLRPRKVQSAAAINNDQHLTLEHEREEARLAAKRDLRAQREAERGAALWGSPAEKADLAARERRAHEDQMAARRAAEELEREDGARAHRELMHKEHALRAAEAAKLESKRAYLAQLKEDNYRLSQQRNDMARYAREEEKAEATRASQQPDGLLNKFGRHAY